MTNVVLLLVASSCLVLWYAYWVRGWYRRWGSSDEELLRPMPGDADIQEPTYSTTLAVTVNAAPHHIWPWLLQLGYRRGGLYSYDWLDRLFGYLDRPSADVLLHEFQDLKVGDEIPLGRGPGFPVTAVDPCRSLVLGGTADGRSVDVAVWSLSARRDANTAGVAKHCSYVTNDRLLAPHACARAGGIHHDSADAPRFEATGRNTRGGSTEPVDLCSVMVETCHERRVTHGGPS